MIAFTLATPVRGPNVYNTNSLDREDSALPSAKCSEMKLASPLSLYRLCLPHDD